MPVEEIPAARCKCAASCVCDDRDNCSCNQSDNFDLEFYKDQLTIRSRMRDDLSSPEAPDAEDASSQADDDDADGADQTEPGQADDLQNAVQQVPSDEFESADESDMGAFLTGTDGDEADESDTEWTEGGEGDIGETTDTTDTDAAAVPKKSNVRGPYNKFGAKNLALAQAGKGMSTRQAVAAANSALKDTGDFCAEKSFKESTLRDHTKKLGKKLAAKTIKDCQKSFCLGFDSKIDKDCATIQEKESVVVTEDGPVTRHIKCQTTADEDHMVYCAWGRNSDKAKYVTHSTLPRGDGKTQGTNHVCVLKSIGSDKTTGLFLCDGCTVVRLIFTTTPFSFLSPSLSGTSRIPAQNLSRDSRCSREGGWDLS